MQVTCLDLHVYNDWLTLATGIKITINNRMYVMLWVYMSYQSHDHEDLFLERFWYY